MRLRHTYRARPGGGRTILAALALCTVLLGYPAWGGPPLKINLFDGLSAGSLPDGQSGWSRSEKDEINGTQPEWWVKYQVPETGIPYLELYLDVWRNGPNLTVTRELRVDEGLKSWQIAGRLKVTQAVENSIYLRVLDSEGRAVASLDRFTISHQQGKRGPGDSYLTFNGVRILPTLKATERLRAIVQCTGEDAKPFQLAWSADKPDILTLEYGDRTLEAPVPNGGRPASPKSLQIFFGWGLGAQGKGTIQLEGLTITTERAEKTVPR